MYKNILKLFLAFFVGSLTGAVTMMLTAPREGKKTRKLIKKNIDNTIEQAEQVLKNVQTQANQITKETRKFVDDQIANLENSYHDTKQILDR